MSELLDLKRRAHKLGLCGRYSDMWNAAESKDELIRLATDSNGASFMCDGFMYGWGLSAEYLNKEFGDYINGNYIVPHYGYTSELYVAHKGQIEARSTLLILLGCKCKVVVPNGLVCKIYMADGDYDIDCKGKCEVVEYVNLDDTSTTTTVQYSGDVSFTQIEKSEW